MVIPKFLQSIGYTVLVITAALFLAVSFNLTAGAQPTNLGVNNGLLMACPATPNCVNSQALATDVAHAIAPLSVVGDVEQTMAQLQQAIEAMPRTKIIRANDHYLYAEVSSKLMKFVDDLEFYLDDQSKDVQVRSAARLGESDLGVNRQRIEELRAKLAA
jgi:uncharacterized protein (DUF1499 family)